MAVVVVWTGQNDCTMKFSVVWDPNSWTSGSISEMIQQEIRWNTNGMLYVVYRTTSLTVSLRDLTVIWSISNVVPNQFLFDVVISV